MGGGVPPAGPSRGLERGRERAGLYAIGCGFVHEGVASDNRLYDGVDIHIRR